MAYGLKLFDANGALILDANPSLGRVLGLVGVSANGSLTDGNIGYGRLWWFLQAQNTTTSGTGMPIVSVNGNTISWSYASGSPAAPCLLFYGVY